MATVSTQQQSSLTSSRSSSVVNGNPNHGHNHPSHMNGHHALTQSDAQSSNAAHASGTTASGLKKCGFKAKKATTDPSEVPKLLAAKISQLESDQAGEKEEEAEIDREVKKANRDLASLLSTVESPLSRFETVQKRYTELLSDMKRLERDYQKSKKRADQLQKEKDGGKSELNKTVTIKDKLEKLCRELQKENKKIKEEQKRLEENERRQRLLLATNIDGMGAEVNAVVGQKEDKGLQKLDIEMDELFKQKFKSFIDQYELRELHFHSLLRTKELEVQYNMAKFEAQKKAAEQEATRSRALSTQVSTFSQTESELRNQLNIYVEKFKQVRDEFHAANLQALSVEAESLAAVLALLDLRHESGSARVEEYIQGLNTCTCDSCPFSGWHGFSTATAGRPPNEVEHMVALDQVSEGNPSSPPRSTEPQMTEQREVVKELKMLGKARLVETTEADQGPETEPELLDDRLFTYLSDGPKFTINPVTSLSSTVSVEIPYPVVGLVAEAVADPLPPPIPIRMDPRPPAYSSPVCRCEEAMEDKTENFFRRFKKPDWFSSVFSGVEDTLNNSNDLFLTFRKEMEEMSKKTKRLEKENIQLSRKHESTNLNIIEMAEQRAKSDKEIEMLKKKNAKLENLCRALQRERRGYEPEAGELEGDEEGTESEYDYDDEEGSEEEGDYDDDTEEEALHPSEGAPPTFGPVPPPPPPPPPTTQTIVNGKTHGGVNGVKH
ncbi:MAG: hypothetical protein M1840_005631 [Geoglossum simile]|nr:MAG: hypothetical protein M1840_005631 [Geoglossum simile]